MTEAIINFLYTIPWFWILVFALLITFLENIFPPAPCDTILVFMGTLVGIGDVGFIPLLVASTIGSSLGFMLMYYLGMEFGIKLVDSNKIKFINSDSLAKPEEWFRKYGYWIIVANRFLSGTRAVISFFAGLTKLSFLNTTILATISALAWNFILVFAGMKLGQNWKVIDKYQTLYGYIITPIVVAVILFFLIKWLIQRRKKLKVN